MPGLSWVMAASAVIWIGLAAYMAFLGKQQKSLEARLAQVEHDHERT